MGFLIETHHYDIHEKLDEQNERLARIEKLLIKHYEDDMLWESKVNTVVIYRTMKN